MYLLRQKLAGCFLRKLVLQFVQIKGDVIKRTLMSRPDGGEGRLKYVNFGQIVRGKCLKKLAVKFNYRPN